MSRLDDALKQALRRQQPPAGFAERVLARVADERPARGRWESLFDAFRLPKLRLAGAVAAVLALVAGSQYYRQQQMRTEGELAKQQVVLALRITAGELQFAQNKVQQLNSVW